MIVRPYCQILLYLVETIAGGRRGMPGKVTRAKLSGTRAKLSARTSHAPHAPCAVARSRQIPDSISGGDSRSQALPFGQREEPSVNPALELTVMGGPVVPAAVPVTDHGVPKRADGTQS